MRALDEMDITIRRRNGKVIAGIPQLKLYAKADTVDLALSRLEQKKATLLADLEAAGEIHEFEAELAKAAPPLHWSGIGKFTVKAVIAACLVVLIIAVTLILYSRLSAISQTDLSTMPDGTVVKLDPEIRGKMETTRVEGNAIIVSGWAIDLSSNSPADTIKVFADGELVGEARPKTDSPETRRVYITHHNLWHDIFVPITLLPNFATVIDWPVMADFIFLGVAMTFILVSTALAGGLRVRSRKPEVPMNL